MEGGGLNRERVKRAFLIESEGGFNERKWKEEVLKEAKGDI